MKTYRRSVAERLTNLTLSLMFFLAAGIALAFSGEFWSPFGAMAFVVFAGAGTAVAVHWISSLERVEWRDSDEGSVLTVRSWGRKKSILLTALTSVNVIPCTMETRLRTEATRLTLSHKLLQFEQLLEQLRSERPDLFRVPTDLLVLRSSRIGILSLLLLGLGTAVAGLVLSSWQPWTGPVFYFAALVPVIRIVFFYPLAYRIIPGRLVIRYLARQKVYDSRQLKRQKRDLYAAGGAVFFLIRLEFSQTTVVLDEGYLRDPVRPVEDWIGVALI